MKILLQCLWLLAMLANFGSSQADDQSPRKSISEYFKNNKLISSRHAFYNAAKTQRVEYYCEDENRPGGANEGASNPANVACAAALFLKHSGQWVFSDAIDLRYGSVEKFSGHRLEVEMLEYGAEDALCCPSERWTRIFDTKTGKLIEDIASKRQPLIAEAVKDGLDQRRIGELISQGNDINAKDRYGQTALMAAAEKSNVEITRLLLAHHADVNATRNNGKTALVIAAGQGSVEIVKLLLDKGADANIDSDEGRSALYYAIRSGNGDIARLLVAGGADVNAETQRGETVLMEAAVSGREDIVRLLLEKGANIKTTYEGTSILTAAAERSRCKIVRLLLDNGANANEENWEVLMRAAAYSRDTDCLQALLEKGANINVKDRAGQTPLFYAAQYGPVANVEWLLKHGADPNVIAYGQTPLEAARKLGNKDVVRFLEKQTPR
ncbi:MAG TPA: ankyrin repeat domain-containing protein [Candidatus Acidoferrales bacterium]|nr:ankyrin repeat domain-containing protein [Candidatus Acidoferrales bacterium]